MKQTNAHLVFLILCCVSTAIAQVTGSGTKGAIPIWKGTTTLGNSPIVSDGDNIGIGTKKPSAKLDPKRESFCRGREKKLRLWDAKRRLSTPARSAIARTEPVPHQLLVLLSANYSLAGATQHSGQ